MSAVDFNSDEFQRLLTWVDIATRPVQDGGPANDEMLRVEARTLYHLLQAREALNAGE